MIDDPLAALANTPRADLSLLAPDSFPGWDELPEPGVPTVRVFTRGDVTVVLVAGTNLFDVIASRGPERRVLVLKLEELHASFAALAELD
ncbi:hypothetical protein [Agromyces sp. NPDC056965]|uniref:hypothetical protein n=1 Tax=Agromyces sp. NPDC056965 TaxID=3345983 RepID=UPI00362EFD64